MQGSFLHPLSPGVFALKQPLLLILEDLRASAEPGRLTALGSSIVVLIIFGCAIYFAQRQEEGIGALL